MSPTLVILAAGIGRRFGGCKQLEAIGPGAATIVDYSVYDAWLAGFGQVVLVIRPEIEGVVRESLGRRIERHVPVAYALQRLDDLPAGFVLPRGRTRLWGTAHALLSAANVVEQPMAVINADDFYGPEPFRILREFLRSQEPDSEAQMPRAAPPVAAPVTFAMVGYRLDHTLPATGTVARAVCRCGVDGWLAHIVEIERISRTGDDGRYEDPSGQTRSLPGSTLVSMNLWGFTPAIFAQLKAGFSEFLHRHGGSPDAEYYLPAVVQAGIDAGHTRVRVLPTSAAWCGVTNPSDAAAVRAMIHALVARGDYPEQLWH